MPDHSTANLTPFLPFPIASLGDVGYSYEMNELRSLLATLLTFILPHAALAAAEEAPGSWTYDGDQNGQEEWASLSQNYITCEIGTAQSPVRIGSTQTAKLPELVFQYKPAKAHMRFLEHALEITVDDAQVLVDNGHRYALKNIRFHSPSEHMVRGVAYIAEIEFMHLDANGNRLMLSVFVEPGNQANEALKDALDHAPDRSGKAYDFTFDPGTLLPQAHGYFSYTGSMTVPPCKEGVEWRVLMQPISLSENQISQVTRIVDRNARLPQPVYMRTIKESQ